LPVHGVLHDTSVPIVAPLIISLLQTADHVIRDQKCRPEWERDAQH
jgi:hypothetical protein